MRYCYVKQAAKKNKSPRLVLFSSLSLFIGVFTLLWSFYPVMAYSIGELVDKKDNHTPVPASELSGALRKNLVTYNDSMAPYYSSYLKDFTAVSDWFPEVPQSLSRKSDIREYQIDIPKLGLTKLKVKVGGEDLSKSLVQYGNQVLPGEIGNAVVLGHSTLPQLFKADDYRTVFTFLPDLERGDKIRVSYNGTNYSYLVTEMFVVKPEEVWVLEEQANDSLLSLITCVPPGTYWKRLVVKAKLEGIWLESLLSVVLSYKNW